MFGTCNDIFINTSLYPMRVLHGKTNISQDVNVTNRGWVIITDANLMANNIVVNQATTSFGIEIENSVVTAKALNTNGIY